MPGDELDFDTLREDNDRYFSTIARYRDARASLFIRSGLGIVVLAFCVFLIYSQLGDVEYLIFAPSRPIALGDVRSPNLSQKTLSSLRSNDFVAFENDIILFDEIRSVDGTYSYYYSPLTHFVVRTPQTLPVKDSTGVLNLSQREVQWIMQRMASPEAFSVSISGQGRLVAAQDVPEWAMGVMNFMANSSGDPVDSMFLLFEGDTPSSYGVDGVLFGLGIALVFLTLLSWATSLKKLVDLKREFESIRKKEMNLNA